MLWPFGNRYGPGHGLLVLELALTRAISLKGFALVTVAVHVFERGMKWFNCWNGRSVLPCGEGKRKGVKLSGSVVISATLG